MNFDYHTKLVSPKHLKYIIILFQILTGQVSDNDRPRKNLKNSL